MWVYNIRQGTMTSPDGEIEGHGYSGQPQYKNDPTAVAIKGEGPIPPNVYRMSAIFDGGKKGKYVCRLTPLISSLMFKRDGMMVHGDRIDAPGTASDGCIIQGRATRLSMSLSEDHILAAVSGDRPVAEELAELLEAASVQQPDPQTTA